MEGTTPTDSTKPKWRHELNHDTEYVFWLLLYWVVCAQRTGTESGKESIDHFTWDALMGSADDRDRLLRGLGLNRATHSIYAPLSPLLEVLANLLIVDRLWLEESDPRSHVEYF